MYILKKSERRKQGAGGALTLFFIFLMQNIHFFTFDTIHKLA